MGNELKEYQLIDVYGFVHLVRATSAFEAAMILRGEVTPYED